MKKSFLLFASLLSLCSIHLIAQPTVDSLFIEGHYRTFRFEKPTTSKGNSSLVFVLHGSGGSGAEMMNRTIAFRKSTTNENVVLVYPDGYKKFWNECRKAATSQANLENINESAFFEGMIDYFKSNYKIDEHQVFAIGTSGGGHMSYKLAMTMPRKFRAVTAIIANLPEVENMDCTEANVAIPIMIVNGTADPLNPYNGGMMTLGNVVLGKVRSTDLTFKYWTILAGYSDEPIKTNLPDNDPSDGKTIERYTYTAKGKPEVTLLKVIGGKHDYPNDIDVHKEAWEFFKRQMN